MQKRFFLYLLALLLAMNSLAQTRGKFVIHGTMTTDSLRNTKAKIQKVYLSHDEDGMLVVVDSAKVINRQFSFRGTAPAVPESYSITGFDNGGITLFLEPGNIIIDPFDGRYPNAAKAHGTPANNVNSEYQQLYAEVVGKSREAMERLRREHAEIVDSEAKFLPYQTSVFYRNTLAFKTAAMKFVARHYQSPVSLYIIRYDLMSMFVPKFVERELLRALDPSLKSHPMYKEIVNSLKAANLKVGSEGPDFTAMTPEGKNLSLSELKGKYVLLDFWASWCGPCRREFPHLREALRLSEGHDNFVILSYSIDTKKNDWLNCIGANALTHPHWLHVSTLKGWGSDAAKLYKVEAVPRTVLLNPKGQIVAFDLRGEEMVNKIKNILEGVETYE
ncbi:TlpA disulfide reductase family protein [Prevotella sp. KH2C16]|uniref:TlpA disulfide reductase family protein n=1 Tax=Prevotella sp. KH2C16 TaxID=1855325 RepID=UPI0015A6B700|nr:TlpA disulfide reductase family protein [Prevotella sp. KH2C16]